MAKILGTVSLGRMDEFKAKLKHPERTAYKAGRSWDSDYTFQEWPNRASMAKSIRMQESGSMLGKHTWKAVQPLDLNEGH